MVDLIGLYKSYLYSMLAWAIQLYLWMILVYVLAGWFVQNRSVGWFSFLEELVEPALRKTRQLTGNRLVIEHFDLSPLVLCVVIWIIQALLPRIFFF